MRQAKLLVYYFAAQLPCLVSRKEDKTFTPYDFQGKGDARTNDTLAVQQALDAAADAGSGTVWIPANATFLVGAGLKAAGHRYNGVAFQLDGTIQVMQPPAGWAACEHITPGFCAGAVLSVYNVDGFTLTSKVNGSIQGFLFDEHNETVPPGGPTFLNSTNVLIEGISLQHLSGSAWIHNCQNVTWRNVFAYNRGQPEETGNLEVGGIGSHGVPFGNGSSAMWQYEVPLLHASNITIRDSQFNGGDDNICIKNDTSNVLVENCSVGDGHGVSIGSVPDCNGCYGYVENLTFRGIQLHGDAPLKIKTWANTTGMIKNILFEDVILVNASTLLMITAWYGNCKWCHEWLEPKTNCSYVDSFGYWGGACEQTDDNIALQNITLRGARGKVVKAGSIICREPAPCTINLEDVQLQAEQGWDCANAELHTAGTNVTPAVPLCRVGPHFQAVEIV